MLSNCCQNATESYIKRPHHFQMREHHYNRHLVSLLTYILGLPSLWHLQYRLATLFHNISVFVLIQSSCLFSKINTDRSINQRLLFKRKKNLIFDQSSSLIIYQYIHRIVIMRLQCDNIFLLKEDVRQQPAGVTGCCGVPSGRQGRS